MNHYIHIIEKDKHKQLIEEQRIDPVSKQSIAPGDTVVVCNNCKTIYHEDTWELLKNRKCCDKSETSPTLLGVEGVLVNQSKSASQKTVINPWMIVTIVLALILGTTLVVIAVKNNQNRDDTTAGRVEAGITEEDKTALKNKVREILDLSQKDNRYDMPEFSDLQNLYANTFKEEVVKFNGGIQVDKYSSFEYANRAINYLKTIEKDEHTIIYNSWEFDKYNNILNVTFTYEYEAFFPSGDSQYVKSRRTYWFDEDFKIIRIKEERLDIR